MSVFVERCDELCVSDILRAESVDFGGTPDGWIVLRFRGGDELETVAIERDVARVLVVEVAILIAEYTPKI